MNDKDTRAGFYIDQKISIALIVVFLFYAFSTVWWAATMASRVSTAEAWIQANALVAARLAVIESLQQSTIYKLDRIETKLDKDVQ